MMEQWFFPDTAHRERFVRLASLVGVFRARWLCWLIVRSALVLSGGRRKTPWYADHGIWVTAWAATGRK